MAAREMLRKASSLYMRMGTVRVFEQNFSLKDAIRSHACSLEALACTALTIIIINHDETRKAHGELQEFNHELYHTDDVTQHGRHIPFERCNKGLCYLTMNSVTTLMTPHNTAGTYPLKG
jgi:hypothetical protein